MVHKAKNLNWPISIEINGKHYDMSPEGAQDLIDQLTKAVAEAELTEFEKQVNLTCQYVCDRETLIEASRILMDAAREELEKTYELIPKGSTHSDSFDRGFELGKQQGKTEAELWRPTPKQVQALKDAISYCSFGPFLGMSDLESLLYDLKRR